MTSSHSPHKILIVGPAWVGDMVMANALFRYLKHIKPDVELHVLAPHWSRPLLERMPEVDQAIAVPFAHGELKLRQRYQLARSLRQQQYQQAIILPRSYKAAFIPYFANIPRRTGWRGEWRYGVINDLRHLNKQRLSLMVQRFLSLGSDATDTTLPDVDAWQPRLQVASGDQNSLLARFGLNSDAPLLAICPGAAYGPAKRWPAAYFAEVAKHQLDKGWQVVLFGAASDKGIAADIQQATQQRCVDLTGATNLGEAIDLLACSQLAVCNDSGLMHIAAALDKPLIAIYGSSSPAYTPPLSNKAHIQSLNLSCSPCFKRECPLGHTRCLTELKPQRIVDIIDKKAFHLIS